MPTLTDHPDYRALLRSVLAAPEDDMPRLVLADWLDEHGEGERGEFIRVQCELAGLERKDVEQLNDDTDWGRCSSVSARWCPNCGDCACRHPDESLSDRDCPLHSPDSTHSCLSEQKWMRDALRQRERTLFGAVWSRWFVLPGLHTPHPSFAPITMVYDLETRRLEYHIRRGFVESVSCTLAALVGGPCEAIGRYHGDRCSGGRIQSPNAQFTQDCPRCSGTGRTPGVAPDLFARQPVTKVTLVEKKPVYSEGSEGCDARWSRQTREGDDSPWVLPPYLFDQLPHRLARYVRDNYHEYESLADSRETLSAACVAWGRQLAGVGAASRTPAEPS